MTAGQGTTLQQEEAGAEPKWRCGRPAASGRAGALKALGRKSILRGCLPNRRPSATDKRLTHQGPGIPGRHVDWSEYSGLHPC